MNPARLVLPALRWRADTGFQSDPDISDRALEAGAGGFIIFGGNRDAVRELTESLTRRAGRPLLFGSDLERGPGQQLEGSTELPPPGALATLGEAAARRAGAITALEARSVGIDWIFAPDADLDLGAENPIVQTRSFGADPARVGRLVGAWIDGCQSAGALACAKHFPGHGRTRIDSHDQMPSVDATAAELAATDLVPFEAAIAHRVASIMTAHVGFPALDPAGRPATLSPPILDLLRTRLGFDGPVVSDAMMMGALRRGFGPGEAGGHAVMAGVDLLLYPDDPGETIAVLGRRMGAEPAFRSRVEQAHARYERLLQAVAIPRAAPDLAEHGRVARELADRLVAARPLAGVRLTLPIELVVIDDDLEGAYPPSPSDFVARRLAEAGVPLGPGGSVVALAFAEPRASKGRGGFGARAKARLQELGSRAALAALFAHPRLAAELPAGVPYVEAWHRQRLMQDAVARAVGARIG